MTIRFGLNKWTDFGVGVQFNYFRNTRNIYLIIDLLVFHISVDNDP